jgi:hypothetical protein
MNNTFNLKRFTWIFRKTILERPVQILGIIILNFILVLLLYSFMREIIGWDATQNLTFLWGLFLADVIYLPQYLITFQQMPMAHHISRFRVLPWKKWYVPSLIAGVFIYHFFSSVF